MAKREQPTHSMLRIQGPGQPSRLEDLLRDQYFVGRGDASGELHVDFPVPGDGHLSRQHCRIFKQNGDYWIQNLGANGTYVGGKLIEEPVQLKNKTKVEIGSETKLEYLELTHSDRSKELQIGTAAEVEKAKKAVAAEKKKSVFQSKWMWAVLGFYGLIMVLVLAMVGSEEAKAFDPGEGPYLEGLLTAKLEPAAASDDARATANRMWAEALREHGGAQLAEGPHAWYLIDRARHALAVLGYATLESALAQNEEIALKARLEYEQLESRLQSDYKLARRLVQAQQFAEARVVYGRIRDAVPDRYAPIRRFAAWMAHRLARWR